MSKSRLSTRPTSVALLLAIAAVSGGVAAQAQQPAASAPASIRIEPAVPGLEVGESLTLVATLLDGSGQEMVADTPLLFFSLARRALEVTPAGLVTAHRPGQHTVLVMLPSDPEAGRRSEAAVSTRVTVTVQAPPLASIEMLGLPARMYAGTRIRLDAQVTDSAGAVRADASPRWDSSDPDVATVNSFGHLQLGTPGDATLTVTAGAIRSEHTVRVSANPARRLELATVGSAVRTGDVVHLSAAALDASGAEVPDMPVQFAFRARTSEHGVGEPPSGLVTDDGRFVADLPGEYTIVATAGDLSAIGSVVVVPRRAAREVELVGHGAVRDRFTSDLWVWEGTDGRDYALTGTWSAAGHAYMWDVTDPGNMQLIDTIAVDARTVNDVKVSEDGRVAVISREGASNRRNGLLILDVSDPAAGMKVLARYDDELTGGVHNVFIHDNHIYALSAGRRYDIINIEDPTAPRRVGRFELDTPGHSIHDVWVEDGIAYSSNWDDGVVVVDVGGGGQGGSPRNPVQMSSYAYPSGWNHAAYPYRSQSTGKFYVFAGDEAGLRGHDPGLTEGLDLMDGFIHIIEWDEWNEPREVARYLVPEAGSHNLWVEDDILYVAFYQGGLRMVDVSGELLGDLYRQGREIAYFKALDPQGWIPNVAMTWGPQPHKGNVFFADMHSGLWAIRIKPAAEGEENQ